MFVGDVLGDADVQKSSSTRYSRVSIDEMDIERMFERTSSMDDQESSAADVLVEDPLSPTDGLVKDPFSVTEDPLSPTDYTLQVDEDEEELNRLDTLP